MKIQICSLIYKSSKFADAVHDSVMKYTPLIHSGEAEFFFQCNDASDNLIKHLENKKYKFFIHNNVFLSDEQLFALGIGSPNYINRVYNGWNAAIKNSNAEILVLINSDNLFSPDWLENLLKYLNSNTIVSSQLVERSHPKYGVFPGAYGRNFGNHPSNFQEANFINFANSVRKDGEIKSGGAYMPCAFYRQSVVDVGMYPPGNIAGQNFYNIIRYGDEDLFLRLQQNNIKHITSLDSIVYHFKEGEMEE